MPSEVFLLKLSLMQSDRVAIVRIAVGVYNIFIVER